MLMLLVLQGHQLMAAVAADNCWLMANSSLPQAWPAASADAALQTRFSTAAAHITRQAMQQAMAAHSAHSSSSSAEQQEEGPKDAESESHVQLLVVGGLGLQAMQLAAAASNVQDQLLRSSQQQQGAAVPSMALSYVPSDSLTAQLASQLFADNDLDDIIDVCSWTELRQQQQESSSSSSEAAAVGAVSCAALLAGVVQPNWSNAVAACLGACRGLAGLTSSSSSIQACVLSPACIRVWAVPVSCKDLLNLNEVDLQEIAQQTAGSYNYAAANAALRRSSRPCQVSRFGPQQLADPVVILELKPQELLQKMQQQFQPIKQQQQQQQLNQLQPKDAAASASVPDALAAVAAALCSAGKAAASTAVQLHTSGRLDCVVWWLEFELSPGCSVSYAPAAAAAAAAAGRAGNTSSSSSSSSKRRQLDVLRPHAWQHVQYLPIQQQQQQQQACDASALAAVCYQGQQATAGQQLLLQVQASVDQLTLSLFSSSSSSSSSNSSSGAAASDGLHGLQQQIAQLSVQQQQQEGAGRILPYHLSMLNDHARTRAYDQGIAAAVRELLQQQQQGEAAVVLDVGCGTGLLSMMAATAAAAGDGDAAKRLQVVGK
jgi:hypothetical protein